MKAMEKILSIPKNAMRKGKEIKKKIRMLTQEETKEMLVLVFRQIIYLLHHARIRNWKGELYLSMEDPYTLGQVLQGIALISPFLGDSFHIYPEFDDSYYYGELKAKGKFRLIHIVIVAVRLLRNRKFRELLFKGGNDGKS